MSSSFFFLFGGVFLATGMLLVGSVFIKKYSALVLLDLDTLRAHQEKHLRDKLIEERMQRTLTRIAVSIFRGVSFPWHVARDAFRRLAGKFVALERRYRRQQAREQKMSSEELQAFARDIERMIREESYALAEERLVELVSALPKYVPAYVLLARVYAAKRDITEAIESLRYAKKLAPQDVDVIFFLATLLDEQRATQEAYALYEEAIALAPKNPKYLDAFIATALTLGKKREAQDALTSLVAVNPDNAKIPEFSHMLSDTTSPDAFSVSEGDKKRVSRKKNTPTL